MLRPITLGLVGSSLLVATFSTSAFAADTDTVESLSFDYVECIGSTAVWDARENESFLLPPRKALLGEIEKVAKLNGAPAKDRLVARMDTAIDRAGQLESAQEISASQQKCQSVFIKIRSGDLHYLALKQD